MSQLFISADWGLALYFNLREVSHLKCFDLLQLLYMLLFQGLKKRGWGEAVRK